MSISHLKELPDLKILKQVSQKKYQSLFESLFKSDKIKSKKKSNKNKAVKEKQIEPIGF